MNIGKESLIFDLFICQKKFEKALKKVTGKFDKLGSNWEILFLIYLHKYSATTQYDLYKRFDIERSYINKIVKKLEFSNLIIMKGEVTLGLYRKEIYLTEAGEEIAAEIIKIIQKFKENLFDKYPLLDAHSFSSNMNTLSKLPQDEILDTVNGSIKYYDK